MPLFKREINNREKETSSESNMVGKPLEILVTGSIPSSGKSTLIKNFLPSLYGNLKVDEEIILEPRGGGTGLTKYTISGVIGDTVINVIFWEIGGHTLTEAISLRSTLEEIISHLKEKQAQISKVILVYSLPALLVRTKRQELFSFIKRDFHNILGNIIVKMPTSLINEENLYIVLTHLDQLFNVYPLAFKGEELLKNIKYLEISFDDVSEDICDQIVNCIMKRSQQFEDKTLRDIHVVFDLISILYTGLDIIKKSFKLKIHVEDLKRQLRLFYELTKNTFKNKYDAALDNNVREAYAYWIRLIEHYLKRLDNKRTSILCTNEFLETVGKNTAIEIAKYVVSGKMALLIPPRDAVKKLVYSDHWDAKLTEFGRYFFDNILEISQ